MVQLENHTHNLRIKIPVEKETYTSYSGNITYSPLEERPEDNKPALCKKSNVGVFSQICYLFTCCFKNIKG